MKKVNTTEAVKIMDEAAKGYANNEDLRSVHVPLIVVCKVFTSNS